MAIWVAIWRPFARPCSTGAQARFAPARTVSVLSDLVQFLALQKIRQWPRLRRANGHPNGRANGHAEGVASGHILGVAVATDLASQPSEAASQMSAALVGRVTTGRHRLARNSLRGACPFGTWRDGVLGQEEGFLSNPTLCES